jgi:hypothetical protein
MTKNNIMIGLRRRPTYNGLVGYLDGGQETMRYPDRLATQLANSYELTNLVDSEGTSWFEENKQQMRNFTEQQVKEVLIKENLEEGQTFEQEKILQRQQDEDFLFRQQAEQGQMVELRRQEATERENEGIVQLFKKELIRGVVPDELKKDYDDWQQEMRDDAQEMRDVDEAIKKEEGVAALFKKEMKHIIAQEAAAFVLKKAAENLPGLISRVV